MADRVVTKPFVSVSPGATLYGPGRYNFGSAADSWINANSEPTTDTSIRPGYAQTIGIYDGGLPAAYARLARWLDNNAG